MTEPPRKDLWQKDLGELSKYDWLTAVGLSLKHRMSPLDLRVAIALMNHADAETKVAWPSQQTLMAYTGVASDRQVRTAVASLCGSGALKRRYIGQVDGPVRTKITRTSRGKAYELQMFWAFETLEASTFQPMAEPSQLQSGKRHRTTLVRSQQDSDDPAEQEPHRTAVVLSDRTTAVRSTQDYGSPPYTEGKPREPEKRAGKADQDVASTREGQRPLGIGFSTKPHSSYAKASRGE